MNTLQWKILYMVREGRMVIAEYIIKNTEENIIHGVHHV